MADINFTYADGTTIEQIIAFEVAAKIWESHLGDDVTVNIYGEITNQLEPEVLGGALPGFVTQQNYNTIKGALGADATTGDDATAVVHLPQQNKGKFEVYANGDHSVQTSALNLTTANAKALGLIDAHGTELDGYITLSDLTGQPGHAWDYDVTRTTAIGSTDLDFLSVVLHEVGHVLGFTSGLDDPGWLTAVQNRQLSGGGKKGKKGNSYQIADSNIGNPLDLFRHSDTATAVDKGKRDWSLAGDAPYLSIDGGKTRLVNLATGDVEIDYGEDGSIDATGDGFQASHWQYNPTNPAGIFDGAITNGVRRNLSEIDLKALDVIGWDRTSTVHSSSSGSGSGSGAGETIRFEAEDLPLSASTPDAYIDIQAWDVASGGQVWSVDDDEYWGSDGLADLFNQTGAAELTFTGPNGVYDVVIGYYDEDDGVAQYQIEYGNTLIDSWSANLDLGSGAPSEENLVNRTVAASMQVNTGDTFTITATEGLSDHARIDYIDFIARNTAPIPINAGGAPIRVEAEDLAGGGSIFTTNAASGGAVQSVGDTHGTGVDVNFNGPAGLYTIEIGYFDALGSGQLQVNQGNTVLDQWTLNDETTIFWSQDFRTRTVANSIQINPGETFTLYGDDHLIDLVLVDYIDFVPVSDPVSNPDPITVFEAYYNEVVTELADQMGVTVAHIEANASNTHDSLTGNFFDDVINLIEASDIYPIPDGWGGGSSGGSSGCGWGCQDFADLFHQRAFYSELPGASIPTAADDDLTTAVAGEGATDELTHVEVAASATETAQQVSGISGILYTRNGASKGRRRGGNAIAVAARGLRSDLQQMGTGSTALNPDDVTPNFNHGLTDTSSKGEFQLMLKSSDAIINTLLS